MIASLCGFVGAASLFIISSTAAAIGWTIPHGILFPFWPGYVRLVEPYHVVPFESSAAPKHGIWVANTWIYKHGIWVNVVSFFNTIDANMVCRLFDNRKYMDIYLPIHQEYCYLGKQKIGLYFSASTCDLHLFRLLKCAICRTIPVKMLPIGLSCRRF